MLPNLNPKQMAQMMRQFGIKTQEIPAEKVVIHQADGKQLTIVKPSIVAMDMQGQKSFQISGELEESASQVPETTPDSKEDDVKLVMEQAHVSREEALQALEESKGDLAAAILIAQRD